VKVKSPAAEVQDSAASVTAAAVALALTAAALALTTLMAERLSAFPFWARAPREQE
jgi:hypothetical protein